MLSSSLLTSPFDPERDCKFIRRPLPSDWGRPWCVRYGQSFSSLDSIAGNGNTAHMRIAVNALVAQMQSTQNITGRQLVAKPAKLLPVCCSFVAAHGLISIVRHAEWLPSLRYCAVDRVGHILSALQGGQKAQLAEHAPQSPIATLAPILTDRVADVSGFVGWAGSLAGWRRRYPNHGGP